MRSVAYILIGLFCLTNVGYAQRGGKPHSPRQKVHTSPGKSRTYHLYKRTHETWQQANDKFHNFTGYNAGMFPSKQISAKITQNPYPKHSPAHILTDPDQITYYFLTKNNLEVRKWLPKLEHRQQFIVEHADELLALQAPVTHPVTQDAAWLAGQISPDTRYLLLGEWHKQPDVQTFEQNFINQLRASGREIVLFTEFIPDNGSWTFALEHDELAYYLPIWLNANAHHTPLFGLEPAYVHQNNTHFVIREETFLFPPALQQQQEVWATPEGMRLRNEHWLSILQERRQEYPDALFIILAGADHVSYDQPYSLGSLLPQEQTQCVLLPSHAYSDPVSGKNEPFLTLFDALTGERLSQRIIQFKNKPLARRVGFDIQLKVTPYEE